MITRDHIEKMRDVCAAGGFLSLTPDDMAELCERALVASKPAPPAPETPRKPSKCSVPCRVKPNVSGFYSQWGDGTAVTCEALDDGRVMFGVRFHSAPPGWTRESTFCFQAAELEFIQ